MGMLDAVRADAGRLSEREQRQRSVEHVVTDPATGEQSITTLTPDVALRVEKGELTLSGDARVGVTLADGSSAVVSGAKAQDLIRDEGARLERSQQERRRVHEETLEQEFGDRPGLAAAQGVARGVTFGGSDAIARGLGMGESVAEVRKRSPRAAMTGEIVGAIAPSLLSGGAGAAGTVARLTPAGAAARLGAGVAARGAGRGLLARSAYAGAGAAAEGALIGAGQGVSEVALGEDPITAERAAAVIGSNALYGAKIGAAAGTGLSLAGNVAAKGLRKAQKIADDAGERMTALAGKADDAGTDLASLDRAGLRKAEQAEKVRLKDWQVTEKAQIADDIGAYRTALDDADPFLIARQGSSRKVLVGSRNKVIREMDAPDLFRRNPRGAVRALEKEGEHLKRVVADLRDSADEFAKADAKVSASLGEELATAPSGAKVPVRGSHQLAMYRAWSGKAATKAGTDISLDVAQAFKGAIDDGSIAAMRQRSAAAVDDMIGRNQALRDRIGTVYGPPTSQKLDDIAVARDTLSDRARGGVLDDAAGAAKGYAAGAVTGLLPGGPLGAAAAYVAPRALGKLRDLVSGRLTKAGAESAKRFSAAIGKVLDTAPVVARVTRSAPPKAILVNVSYAPEGAFRPPRPPRRGAPRHLAAYQMREAEIRSQTTPGPDGRSVVTPGARQRIARQLHGVALQSPVLADRMETVAVRRLEFLASKLATRPDAMAMTVGPSRWRPSEMDMDQFARYVAAVEDPASVMERVADTTVTPQDAEAMRAVYPELYNQTRAEVIAKIPELREDLPYAKRLSLSVFFGVPVDPSMDPAVLRTLQGNYENEPGTEGGTVAPRAQPQFASVSKPEPTAAQERAG